VQALRPHQGRLARYQCQQARHHESRSPARHRQSDGEYRRGHERRDQEQSAEHCQYEQDEADDRPPGLCGHLRSCQGDLEPYELAQVLGERLSARTQSVSLVGHRVGLYPFPGHAKHDSREGRGTARVARRDWIRSYASRVPVVVASSLRKEFAGALLFEGVSFALERGQRMALSGANGVGKSTLLQAIAGRTELQAGEVALEKGTQIALHDQRPPLEHGLDLRAFMLAAGSELVAVEDELARLEEAMSSGQHDPATLRRYSELQARLDHAGGYGWRTRFEATARGLGFSDADLSRPLETLSGGELTRASLARTLGEGADLLLLDEPTNHLDVRSIEWLETELARFDGALVVVAHDRWFLEAVTNCVLELEQKRAVFFAGPWHAWREERVVREHHAAKVAARQAEDIARLERFVARFRYGTKARQAQSKLKQIARIEAAKPEVLGRGGPTLGFEFLKADRSGRTVVEAKALAVAAGGRTLIEDVDLALERGEHAALVGANGSGKTTLVETLIGRRPPATGTARLGYGVRVGFFSQHTLELDERGNVIDCARSATGLGRADAQKLLGRFLFSGYDVQERPVRMLSGGERRRLALALLVASGANFLVLDEPTNHLDLDSREALEAALEAFEGTLLIVSHDRALLDAVAARTISIEEGRLRSYDGRWADYVRAREQERAPAKPETAPKERKKSPPERSQKSPQVRERECLEQEIERLEAQLASLEQELAEDWADVEKLSVYRTTRGRVDRLLARWDELVESESSLDWERPPAPGSSA
jgi:ATP-binding cassette subfamily F protein 3